MTKLQKLRKELVKHGIDGYIIPSSDEFGNEFVPDYNNRLQWLTGFTGSSGVAIVTKDQAAFFTDGRYTIQAKKQVNKEFTCYNSADNSYISWIKENTKTPGFDANILTIAEAEKLKQYGINAKPLAENPIDILWQDRPQVIKKEAFVHPVWYAGMDYKSKIKHICNYMQSSNIDYCLISAVDSVCWLFNIRGYDANNTPLLFARALLAKDGKAILFVDEEKINIAVRKHLQGIKISSLDTLSNSINSLKNKNIAADKLSCPYIYQRYIAKIIYHNCPTVLLKACKNNIEIKGAKKAHIKDGVAITKFLNWFNNSLNKGRYVDELLVAEKLYEYRKEQKGFVYPSFTTIAGFAKNGAIVHYKTNKASNKVIKKSYRSLLLIDSGGQYYEGTTDLTRTIAIGRPTKQQKIDYTNVLKGHIAIATCIFPEGTTGSQLDILARQYLWQNYSDYDHGTGHGVGSFLSVHEGPQRISKICNNTALLPGMILSNEPGIYREGQYGIRLENLVLVVEKKLKSKNKLQSAKRFFTFETISLVPFDSKLIDKTMLTKHELVWLSNYNKAVGKI